jgi:hypothetical protein
LFGSGLRVNDAWYAWLIRRLLQGSSRREADRLHACSRRVSSSPSSLYASSENKQTRCTKHNWRGRKERRVPRREERCLMRLCNYVRTLFDLQSIKVAYIILRSARIHHLRRQHQQCITCQPWYISLSRLNSRY